MPRTGKIEPRKVLADPIFQSPLVTKLINRVMKNGKKAVAQKIVYTTFENIKTKGNDPIKTFEKALENIMPKMEVRPRRVGGASYMVPMEVRGIRRQSLGISWLVESARGRSIGELANRAKNQPVMIAKLTQEITEAAEGTGKAVQKREDIHRMAEANKAFAHFRW